MPKGPVRAPAPTALIASDTKRKAATPLKDSTADKPLTVRRATTSKPHGQDPPHAEAHALGAELARIVHALKQMAKKPTLEGNYANSILRTYGLEKRQDRKPGNPATADGNLKMLMLVYRRLFLEDTWKSIAIDQGAVAKYENKIASLKIQLERFCKRVYESVARCYPQFGKKSLHVLSRHQVFHAVRDWPGLENYETEGLDTLVLLAFRRHAKSVITGQRPEYDKRFNGSFFIFQR